MSDAASVTLSLYCPKYGQAVSLSYLPSDSYAAQSWTCPYLACHTVHKVSIYATDLRAVARYEPPKE